MVSPLGAIIVVSLVLFTLVYSFYISRVNNLEDMWNSALYFCGMCALLICTLLLTMYEKGVLLS